MNNEIKEELLGMTSDVKDHMLRRDEYNKKLNENSKKKFIAAATENSCGATIEIIENIVKKYVDNLEGTLYSENLYSGYEFKGVKRLGVYSPEVSMLSLEHRFGFNNLIQDLKFNLDNPKRILMSWRKSNNECVPAFVDLTFFKEHNLKFETEHVVGTDYKIYGKSEDIKKFVNDALNNRLGENYKLSNEFIKEMKDRIKEINRIKKAIKDFKVESRRNTQILFLDIIKALNKDYKEKSSTDLDPENNSKLNGVILIDETNEFVNILKKRNLYDVFYKYDYICNIVPFKHPKDGDYEYLMVLNNHVDALEHEIYDLFYNTSANYNIGQGTFTVTVPVCNFEDVVLDISKKSNKK